MKWVAGALMVVNLHLGGCVQPTPTPAPPPTPPPTPAPSPDPRPIPAVTPEPYFSLGLTHRLSCDSLAADSPTACYALWDAFLRSQDRLRPILGSAVDSVRLGRVQFVKPDDCAPDSYGVPIYELDPDTRAQAAYTVYGAIRAVHYCHLYAFEAEMDHVLAELAGRDDYACFGHVQDCSSRDPLDYDHGWWARQRYLNRNP